MIAIIRRELGLWFTAPFAWALLAVLLFLSAYVFLLNFEQYLLLQEKLRELANPPGLTRYLLVSAGPTFCLLLLVVTSLLSGNAIAAERRDKTLGLLLSAPIGSWQIVLGKFLSLLALSSIYIGIVGLMPISLVWVVEIDMGNVFSALLGIWLLSAACIAVGIFMSCLTTQPSIATISSLGLLLFLWLLSANSQQDSQATALTQYLALPGHLQSFLAGVLDSRDISYFVSLTALFLGLSMLRLGAIRQTS